MTKSDATRKPCSSKAAMGQVRTEGRRSFGLRALGALIDPLARPVLRRKPSLAVQVILDWPHIVGPSLARLSAPRKLSGGTLTIACAGPAAVEMQYLVPQLLERVNAMAGGATPSMRDGGKTPLRFKDPVPLVSRVRIIHDAVLEQAIEPPKRKSPAPVAIEAGHRQPIHDVLQRLGGHISAREGDNSSS